MPVISEISKNKLDIRIKIKSIYEKNLFGTNLVFKIPTPKSTSNVVVNAAVGRAKYEPENGGIVWRIKKYSGELESLLRFI